MQVASWYFFGCTNPNKCMVFGQHIDSIIIRPSGSKECRLFEVHHHDQLNISKHPSPNGFMNSQFNIYVAPCTTHIQNCIYIELHSMRIVPLNPFCSYSIHLNQSKNVSKTQLQSYTHTQDIHKNNMQHESKAFGKPSTHIFLHQWLIYTCLKCAINFPSKCNSNCAWIGQATFHISSMWV